MRRKGEGGEEETTSFSSVMKLILLKTHKKFMFLSIFSSRRSQNLEKTRETLKIQEGKYAAETFMRSATDVCHEQNATLGKKIRTKHTKEKL